MNINFNTVDWLEISDIFNTTENNKEILLTIIGEYIAKYHLREKIYDIVQGRILITDLLNKIQHNINHRIYVIDAINVYEKIFNYELQNIKDPLRTFILDYTDNHEDNPSFWTTNKIKDLDIDLVLRIRKLISYFNKAIRSKDVSI